MVVAERDEVNACSSSIAPEEPPCRRCPIAPGGFMEIALAVWNC